MDFMLQPVTFMYYMDLLHLNLFQDSEKSSQHSNDFPGFVYPPVSRSVELMKPLTNGDLHPGLGPGNQN